MNDNIEMLEPIHTRPGMGRALIHHDRRSRNFRAMDRVPKGASLRTKTWRRGEAYDQGQTSTCVAQTGKGILNTSPMSSAVDYDTRSEYSIDEFYNGAQRMDEWQGEAYDGTSGLGLCRYLKSAGLITEYRWCFGLDEVLATLSYVGPVGLGVWWKTGMFYPEPYTGLIRPTGANEGGHEVELIGIDLSKKRVIGMNSWGEGWGHKGRFTLTFDDLGALLAEDGDAFVTLK